MRLQQEFTSQPSHVRFTLRAYLVDSVTRRVIASREFDAAIATTSDDPYGGVVAANRAVHAVLDQLENFCAGPAASWQPTVINTPIRKKESSSTR